MARKIFKKVGLKRDNNLGDLSNSTEALNNLIGGLVDNISIDTFISEDLDCIRGIYSAGLDNTGYSQIKGSAVKFTDSSGSNAEFTPRITYQNRLDRFKTFSGEPRFNGGNGLTARYFNPNQVFENTVGIFSGIPFKTDNFWENGNFQYSGKLTPESVDVNGGVEWEGYFIPTQTGLYNFYINSSACFTFDFETQGYLSDPTGSIITFSRYYSASLGGFHFYTSNPSLEDLTGYNLQNTEAFFAYTTQVSNTTPLYRAFNSSGPHLYTTNKNEYDNLPSNIWTKENIVGYVYASAPVNITNQPVYRAYNSTTGDYLLTTSLTEATTSSGYTNQPASVFYAPYLSYTEINRIGLTSSLSVSGTSGSNQITLTTASNAKYVGVGQSVSGVGIYTGSVVSSVDRTTGIIGLNPPTGITANTVTANFTNQNKTFFKTIGQDIKISYSTYILNAQQRYRIKARYYIPSSVDALSAQRNINFVYIAPTGGTSNLRYTNLYSFDYDFSDAVKGEFPIFIDNSIRSGGGTLGGVLSDNYVKVKSLKKVDIKYQPKTSLTDITKNTITGTTRSNSNVVTLSNTTNLEIGNYVFGTGIPENARINQILINTGIIIDTFATDSGSTSLTFIEHRGFVKRIQGSASTTTFTLSIGDTTDLKSGMILIGPGASAYTGITTTSSPTTFTITPSQSLAASTYYVYQSRGLVNESLNAFCNRTITKCLTVAAPGAGINTTIIPVESSADVSTGWKVQGFYFASGTTINGAPPAGNIVINTPTIRALVAGANFTVTGEPDDRQLCCPPTDTSPPFSATLDGLETVFAEPAAPSLRIESGNVIFSALTAVVSPSNITPLLPDSSSYTSTSRISIQTPIGTYKILCA
jgi:hypothetical protein